MASIIMMRRYLCICGIALASAQFGNLVVKWQTDETTGSKDAVPQMGSERPPPKADGRTRTTNLGSLSTDRLQGIIDSFGLSCDTCSTQGHWISRVRAGGEPLPG